TRQRRTFEPPIARISRIQCGTPASLSYPCHPCNPRLKTLSSASIAVNPRLIIFSSCPCLRGDSPTRLGGSISRSAFIGVDPRFQPPPHKTRPPQQDTPSGGPRR